MEQVVTPNMRRATEQAIQRIAWYTANFAKGAKREAAITHCKRLGIDPNQPLS
jgi:hypothetical protein